MFPAIPDRFLTELGRTEGSPAALAFLARAQDTRRLLILRAVLDAVTTAPPSLVPPPARHRFLEDWSLLSEADTLRPAGSPTDASGAGITGAWGNVPPAGATARGAPVRGPGDAPAGAPTPEPAVAPECLPAPESPAAPGGAHPPVGSSSEPARATASTGGPTPPCEEELAAPGAGPVPVGGSALTPAPGARDGAGGRAPSAARARLFQPLVGAWAQHVLRLLASDPGRTGAQLRARDVRRDLEYFSALAAAAAARAGLDFRVRLTARDGLLVLPSVGALRTGPGDVPVDVEHRDGRLVFRRTGAADVVVRLERGVGAWSGAAVWTSAHALPGLVTGAAPTPLDDLDPYRAGRGSPHYRGPSGPASLDDAERKRWLQSWSGTAVELRLGGEQRLLEAVTLLRCLVPLTSPPGMAADDCTGGTCSGTRREAFGAVLSSTPQTPAVFAATLVHELQHTKMVALSEHVTLHRAGGEQLYFAPWRPDPRPFDGLLQGAYSHLALADFFQRRALTVAHPADRESAWAVHARCREQVGAALPALVGCPDLTVPGRRLVDEMVAVHERLGDHPAPRGHTARAQAYVAAARALHATHRIRPTE